MPTLLDARSRQAIVERLHRLAPTSTPAWGTLTAPRMLCHLADQLRVGMGELPTRRTDSAIRRSIIKWIVVYTPMRPPRGRIQTAPEMLTSAPTTWESDLGTCVELVERLGTTPTNELHPYFGRLTHGEWGRLAWKHLDHHLRQFGV
jgi:hypothetical protein